MEKFTRPISGGWFSIYWWDRRHVYWNTACMNFTAAKWEALIRDMASLGQEYIVMCNCISDGRCVYESKVAPKIEMVCPDPLEAVMNACDKYGMKVFLSNDYYREVSFEDVLSPDHTKARMTVIEELAEKYSHHKSFYGWYWAWEAYIAPLFSEDFVKYFNDSSEFARRLTPNAKFLTAPYGTKNAVFTDEYCRQIERLDTDIIAYQDTVGCFAMNTDESARAFETLRKAHDKVPQRALWADVETFAWEGKDNRREVPLIPAGMERLEKQLEAVSPYVDRVLVFIFQGLFTNPESIAFTGYEPGAKYWNEYVEWLKAHHPEALKM
ncbi:MAG: DUF4434 domain-containing protein [Eubacteriales bacterium]|nr:DUF4434 domain-containing protein [Eubacteriales bacterium]